MSEGKKIPINIEKQTTPDATAASPETEDADASKQPGEPREVRTLETVEAELEALKAEFKEKLETVEREERERYQAERDLLMRTAAAAENAKKRLETDTQRQLKYANENLIEELVPVLDSLDLGLKAVAKADPSNTENMDTEEVAKLSEGMQLVQKQLLDVLKKHGLTPIAAVDEIFDPTRHEAILAVESDEIPAGKVVEEYRGGYLLHERVIRAAQVVVSQGAPEKKEAQPDEDAGEIDTAEVSE